MVMAILIASMDFSYDVRRRPSALRYSNSNRAFVLLRSDSAAWTIFVAFNSSGDMGNVAEEFLTKVAFDAELEV